MLHRDKQEYMNIYFLAYPVIPVMVSCSVTEYASSASSLTEYSSRHVLTRYRPSLFTHRALVLQADFEYRKPAGIAG